MPRVFDFNGLIAQQHGPSLIGIGLAVVLAAQAFPVIPIAAAIAFIGLGATQALSLRHQRELLLMNALIYIPLVLLAVTAQWDARLDLLTIIDAIVAAAMSGLTTARVLVSKTL